MWEAKVIVAVDTAAYATEVNWKQAPQTRVTW